MALCMCGSKQTTWQRFRVNKRENFKADPKAQINSNLLISNKPAFMQSEENRFVARTEQTSRKTSNVFVCVYGGVLNEK